LYPELECVVENRRWIHRKTPFPHVIASQVFKGWFYEDLEAAFSGIMANGFGNSPDQFSRRMANYDAYSINFRPDVSEPLNVFISPAWHKLLTTVAGVETTCHINATIHHHQVGSASGRVHTDLNPAWFLDRDMSGHVQVAQHELCSYKHGFVSDGASRSRETIRAIAMLFYLCNPDWTEGDGGETGLYGSRQDPVEKPVAVVPPINNSLLLFECTPYSFHSFLGNRRSPRNSVIMWLHREKAEVLSRWGESSIEGWPPATLRTGLQ